MEEEKKTPEREEEQALPVQELPTDIPAEVRQKLAEDLNEQATEDLRTSAGPKRGGQRRRGQGQPRDADQEPSACCSSRSSTSSCAK